MKKILFILIPMLFIAIGTVSAQKKAVIVADTTVYDFGEIKEEGGIVSCVFKINNAGEAPLVITRVITPCGCTTTEWTKEPIAPGESGEIKVSYNTAGRPGPFTKVLSIYSNGKNGSYALTIRGKVLQ